jgi:hypothetical protein
MSDGVEIVCGADAVPLKRPERGVERIELSGIM